VELDSLLALDLGDVELGALARPYDGARHALEGLGDVAVGFGRGLEVLDAERGGEMRRELSRDLAPLGEVDLVADEDDGDVARRVATHLVDPRRHVVERRAAWDARTSIFAQRFFSLQFRNCQHVVVQRSKGIESMQHV